MKFQPKILSKLVLFFFILSGFSLNAQIQDIKRNSNENKINHSNNHSSNSDKTSDIASGCFSSIFDILASGCLNSLFASRDSTSNFVVVEPDNNNQNQIVDQNLNHPEINNIEDSTRFKPKLPNEFSLDINANFAFGYQYGTAKSYTYYDFLPGLRANLAWFAIDYRYNMLTEINKNLPDAFKTWDLLFLLKLNADENTNIILGTGIHKEEHSNMNFNEHMVGVKIGLSENRGFLIIDGRLAIDYTTGEYPFLEVGINYNKRFITSKNLNGYFTIGGIYQNYYSKIDIWSFKAGVVFNWHN